MITAALFRNCKAVAMVALLALLCLFPVTAVVAAEDAVSDGQPPATAEKQEPKCVHGCERWGKVCNVDPRGAYKCRRRCEKFGKICE